MRTAWITVACAEHVRRGRAGGFVQVCHGKAGPLRRLKPGDGVACYSPSERFCAGPPLRAITAIGIVAAGEPYEGEGGLWRRDVDWADTAPVPIAPLLPELAFSAGRRDWGVALRFGLVAVPPGDWRRLAGAAGLTAPQP